MASEGDNSAGTCQQLGAALMMSPEEVNPVLEATVVTTDNLARPMDISMLHDYAMDHVFSFLSMTDLKNCRLVNHSWNRVSYRAIQKRDYTIHFPYYQYRSGIGRRPDRMEDIPKLVQLIGTSFQFPWTKFMVEADLMGTAEYQLANLLPAISPLVTVINIHNLRNLPSLEYPNLRKLTLWFDSANAVPKGSSRNSLLRLVERASKLYDIDITGTIKTPLFMDILEIPNFRKITRLSLSGKIQETHLLRLSEMGLQLKFLSLHLELKEFTAESVRAVLLSQSTCLEHLGLSSDEHVSLSNNEENEIDPQRLLGLECPRMEKLKELTVYSVNLYSRISYKDMFPALRKLSFRAYERYPVDSFFSDDIEPVETVEYLRFGKWPGYPERILQAARQFPKLRRVFLFASRNLLNVLGHAMPQLEEMDLEFGDEDDMDSILTGFSSEEVETLKGLPVNQLDVMERSKQPVHFLKKLRRLRIRSDMIEGEGKPLSDFGCRFALLKMKHLRVLELEGSYNQINEPVMERMREKFVVRFEEWKPDRLSW